MNVKPIFTWRRDTKQQTAMGIAIVEDDGSVLFVPHDDFYSGSLTPDEARGLALAILERQK